MTNEALKEAIDKISCNPKKMKEQLFQYGVATNNVKGSVQLASAMIDQCGIGAESGTKKKRSGPKRPPSAYNIFIKECFARHKSDADYGFKPTGVKCRAEWKSK